LAIAPLVFGKHEKRPPKPPRLMMIDLSVDYARRTQVDPSNTYHKRQLVKITISTHNRSTSQDYTGMIGYLYVLAEDMGKKGKYKLIIKQEHKLDVPHAQRTQWESQEVELLFDDHPPVMHGDRCYGYVYAVEDKEGKVIMGHTSNDKLWEILSKLSEKNLDEAFSF
jgi:hypothetical protein